MLVIFVFVISFFTLLFITQIFPIFPPGQLLCELFGNSESDYLIMGISGEVLVSGIINGLVWGVITIIIYSYLKGPSKEKVKLPVWVPGYTTSHNSKIEKRTLKKDSDLIFQKIRKIQDIETIEGIGYIYGRKFRKIGIKTVDDLLQIGITRDGQNYLAKNIGVLPSTIINWVYQAEALN